jgi:Cu(I)/Ag(I) efflux system protein CusF
VTIAHDPIKALNWPAMTMPFKVADKALLAKVKVGAKVRFDLSGQTITAIRPQ